MKFLHVADLHIGKIVNEFSMLEDQKFILNQIREMTVVNQVDALVIAGDIYDRSIPTAEAVALLDSFLTDLSEQDIQIILISGNHDSPERISFGEKLLDKQGVHIAGVQKEQLTKITLNNEGSKTEFVLLPFCKPAVVNARTSEEAVRTLLEKYWRHELECKEQEQEKNQEHKNRVLITHFFVTDAGRAPELSDSETTIHIGGLDNVDASVFEGFDYVALGHIHKSQQIGQHHIWYAGAPLKYSFGEFQNKTALLVTMTKDGLESVKPLELRPLREMRKMKGTLQELLHAVTLGEVNQDYIQALLTDEGELIDPIGTLRGVYPNIMQIVRQDSGKGTAADGQDLSPNRVMAQHRDTIGLFEAFYETVREKPLSEDGKKVIVSIAKELEVKP